MAATNDASLSQDLNTLRVSVDDRKPAPKVTSTLSPDVAPFVPRSNCTLADTRTYSGAPPMFTGGSYVVDANDSNYTAVDQLYGLDQQTQSVARIHLEMIYNQQQQQFQPTADFDPQSPSTAYPPYHHHYHPPPPCVNVHSNTAAHQPVPHFAPTSPTFPATFMLDSTSQQYHHHPAYIPPEQQHSFYEQATLSPTSPPAGSQHDAMYMHLDPQTVIGAPVLSNQPPAVSIYDTVSMTPIHFAHPHHPTFDGLNYIPFDLHQPGVALPSRGRGGMRGRGRGRRARGNGPMNNTGYSYRPSSDQNSSSAQANSQLPFNTNNNNTTTGHPSDSRGRGGGGRGYAPRGVMRGGPPPSRPRDPDSTPQQHPQHPQQQQRHGGKDHDFTHDVADFPTLEGKNNEDENSADAESTSKFAQTNNAAQREDGTPPFAGQVNGFANSNFRGRGRGRPDGPPMGMMRRGKPPPGPLHISDFTIVDKRKGSSQKNKKQLKPDSQESAETASAIKGNPLDNSTPAFHKGKTRATPKKKQTTLKKAMMKERDDPDLLHDSAICVDVCESVWSGDVDKATKALFRRLQPLQDRVYAKDPEKGRQKKRLVFGLREILKQLKLQKVKAVVIAPDIDQIACVGGLDNLLASIIRLCDDGQIPYVFSLTKKLIGRLAHKSGNVSGIGILNPQGADTEWSAFLSARDTMKTKYEDVLQQKRTEVTDLNDDGEGIGDEEDAESEEGGEVNGDFEFDEEEDEWLNEESEEEEAGAVEGTAEAAAVAT